MHFSGIFSRKKCLFGEDDNENNNKKEDSKFVQISNVTVALEMQLSRDWGEVSV